ncbi:MAG: ABC transporter permease [Oscillospiraceae bacterium]|jgi:peptide/nickel transport system permease protein|nr:ABC transporter permease [Oscillospiraceae bacterium]
MIQSVRGLLSALVCLLVIVSVNFFLPRLMPGDPVLMLTGLEDDLVSEAEYRMYREKLGVDDPLYAQFGRYVSALLRGNLGYSYHYKRGVGDMIAERLSNTLSITLPAVALSSALAMLLALYAGSKRGSAADSVLTGGAIIINAVPGFLIGMLIITLFAYKLGWLPFGGLASAAPKNALTDRLSHLVLPITALSLGAMPGKYLILRNQTAAAIDEKYVIYARARGISERRIRFCHIFRNVSQTFVTMIGLNVGFVLSGSLIAENLFSIRGMGQLMTASIAARDFPTMQGCLFVSALAVISADIVTRLVCIAIDPKVRLGVYETE